MSGTPYLATALMVLLSSACSEHASKKPAEAVDGSMGTEVMSTWYKPSAAVTWQWQLKGNINTNYQVEIYDIDLFDTPIATIQSLKARGTKVICYFSAGSSEDWREDYSSIPEAIKGNQLDDWPGEKWLDIRTEAALTLAKSRLDRAVLKGCDGVEPDNVDGFANNTGFPLTGADQIRFLKALATEAHNRKLAIALKNNVDQIDELVSDFDFAVNEECHEYDECEAYQAFIKAGKPVLNAEYKANPNICEKAKSLGLKTLILPLDLDDSSRVSCD